MLFREHVLSDVLPHLHNKNDNAHKLFFTSSQNSTFSLRQQMISNYLAAQPEKLERLCLCSVSTESLIKGDS